MLEKMFLGQGVIWDRIWRQMNHTGQQPTPDFQTDSMRDCAILVQQNLIDLASQRCVQDSDDAIVARRMQRSTKRARLDDMSDRNGDSDAYGLRDETGPREHHSDCCQGDYSSSSLPLHLVDDLVDIYFDKVHPWIPMLHVRNFRQRISDPTERQKLNTVLDAIVSLCIRFSNDLRFRDSVKRAKIAKACRDRVILRSMESFSVENLQALIICAFETVRISILSIGGGTLRTDILGCRLAAVEDLQLG